MRSKIMETIIKKNTFYFVRQLIKAERYKQYKKQFWGGADVIFASPEELDKKNGDEITIREQLKDLENDNLFLVETNYASAIIWLVETLKSYVNVDYLSKYKYYRSIGECVSNNKSISNEKDLLFKILDDPKVTQFEKQHNKETEYDSCQKISKFHWEDWYNYGIENSNPFFVKFMALWIAFNQIYRQFPGEVEDKKGKHHDERQQIKECLKHDRENKLLTKELFDKIFYSPFIEVFMHKSVKVFDRQKRDFNDDKFKNHDTVRDKNEEWGNRIEALFMMIYTVRCNLFHGSKKTSEPRDVKLVQYSGEILEMYLEGTSDRPSFEYGNGEKIEI